VKKGILLVTLILVLVILGSIADISYIQAGTSKGGRRTTSRIATSRILSTSTAKLTTTVTMTVTETTTKTVTTTVTETTTTTLTNQCQLTIGVSPAGGGSTTPLLGVYLYDSGSSVTVSETPATGYAFDYWDLDGSNVGSSPVYTVVVESSHTLTAIFRPSISGQFYTGTGYGEMCDPYNSRYPEWNGIRDKVKIYRLMVFSRIEDDGTLNPWGEYGWPDWGVTYDQLLAYCDEITARGAYPVVSLWIGNFEEISENGVQTFLQKWAAHLGNNKVIFVPAWEFNQPPDWGHWGKRVGGGDGTWYIEPSVYNSKMTLIREVRDSLGITNILIGAHANLWRTDAYNEEGDSLYLPWIDGIRQADVVGVSGYDDNVDEMWLHAEHFYDLINQTKPFFFFEYANECFWNGKNVSADFVNATYAKIPSYPFVKALIWWTGQYVNEDTIPTIGENAAAYDGYNRP